MKGSRWGCCWITAGGSVIPTPWKTLWKHIIQPGPPPHMPATVQHTTKPPTLLQHRHMVNLIYIFWILPPTIMGFDHRKRNENMCFQTKNAQHAEEAWAPSCSIAGAAVGHRWTKLRCLSRVASGAGTNSLNRAKVSCTTQLMESDPLGFRHFPLFYVTSFF